MSSFQAKTGWERPRKREYKNYRSYQFLPDQYQRIRKKQQKIFKKLNNTIIDSFQAKTGWERPRKRENKNYRSNQFLPDREQKIRKKQQNKFKK